MIREAKEKDCINLAGLSLSVWFNTYAQDGIQTVNSRYAISTFTEQAFVGFLNDSKYKLLVDVEGVYIRGYVLVNFESFYESRENGFEIDKLYVHGPFQGRGYGKKLLAEIGRKFGEKFWLHTWAHNKSIDFYKNYGFRDIGKYDFMLGSELIENRVLSYTNT